MRFLPVISRTIAPRFASHRGTAAPIQVLTADNDAGDRDVDPDAYRGATILLAAATLDTESFAGTLPAPEVRVVIAPGFGPTLLSEAVRQGILLVALSEEVIDRLMAFVESNSRQEMTVDLEAQLIDIPGLGQIAFEAPPRVRERLLRGLDDLDELIQHHEEAITFRTEDRKRRPWLYGG